MGIQSEKPKKKHKEEKKYKGKIENDLYEKGNGKNNFINEEYDISLIKRKKKEFSYDISIKIESLNELLNGWDIKYGKEGMKNYLSIKDKKILLIGLLGLKNVGKSFVLSRLLNEDISQKEGSDNLYLKYMIDPKKILN